MGQGFSREKQALRACIKRLEGGCYPRQLIAERRSGACRRSPTSILHRRASPRARAARRRPRRHRSAEGAGRKHHRRHLEPSRLRGSDQGLADAGGRLRRSGTSPTSPTSQLHPPLRRRRRAGGARQHARAALPDEGRSASDWGFILTDVTQGLARQQRAAGVPLRHPRVKPSGLACELVVWIELEPTKRQRRLRSIGSSRVRPTPSASSPRGRHSSSSLCTSTTASKAADRIPELKAIAEWLAAWAEREFGWDHNLIALGDFNIDRQGDPLYRGLHLDGADAGAAATGAAADDLRQAAGAPLLRPDRLVHQGPEPSGPVLNLDCSAGGSFDFVPELQR